MNKFVESNHCEARNNCKTCRTSKGFVSYFQQNFDWDGNCPHGFTEDNLPTVEINSPCLTKICRLGDVECEDYHACRDTCKVESKRITSMDNCPKIINQMEDL